MIQVDNVPNPESMTVPGTLAKAIEEFPPDSPMVDFLDTNLAQATQYHYIELLRRFFDSLGLNGTLDKQSREFLTRAEIASGSKMVLSSLYVRRRKEQSRESYPKPPYAISTNLSGYSVVFMT